MADGGGDRKVGVHVAPQSMARHKLAHDTKSTLHNEISCTLHLLGSSLLIELQFSDLIGNFISTSDYIYVFAVPEHQIRILARSCCGGSSFCVPLQLRLAVADYVRIQQHYRMRDRYQ